MDQCFELGYYGNNTFSVLEAYSLPVNVRSYYYAKLVGIKEAEKAEYERLNQENKGSRR